MSRLTKIILARHGESLWNSELRVQGQKGSSLSPKGERQAEALAERLASMGPTLLYSSPLSRALQTARRVEQATGLKCQLADDLVEISFGEWEGLTVSEVIEQYPGLYEQYLRDPTKVRVPGGESVYELQERVLSALLPLVSTHEGETVVIVSHGGVNKAVLAYIMGLDLSYWYAIKQENACINVVLFGDVRPRVALLNDTCHLKD